MSAVRPHLREDGIPTRCDLRFMTPAELAIRAAMHEVEMAGASTALTDAVNLLQLARERVADHVEGIHETKKRGLEMSKYQIGDPVELSSSGPCMLVQSIRQ